MAVPKRKTARNKEEEEKPARPRGRQRDDEDMDDEAEESAAAPDVEEEDKDEADEDDDFADAPLELGTPARDAEVDQRQVQSVTDRIFGSVLSKYGWQMDERGRLEHVGEEENGSQPAAASAKKSESRKRA